MFGFCWHLLVAKRMSQILGEPFVTRYTLQRKVDGVASSSQCSRNEQEKHSRPRFDFSAAKNLWIQDAVLFFSSVATSGAEPRPHDRWPTRWQSYFCCAMEESSKQIWKINSPKLLGSWNFASLHFTAAQFCYCPWAAAETHVLGAFCYQQGCFFFQGETIQDTLLLVCVKLHLFIDWEINATPYSRVRTSCFSSIFAF